MAVLDQLTRGELAAVCILIGAAIAVTCRSLAFLCDEALRRWDSRLSAHVDAALRLANEDRATANVRAFDALGKEANR